MAVVGLGSLLSIMDFGIVAIGSPSFIIDFQTDASVIVWISLAYYLGSTAPALTFGWISDTLGRKRMYFWGIIVVIISLGLSALAQDVGQLIAVRVLTALGHAMILSNDNALITQDFPPHERGTAQGLNNMALGVGIGGGFYLGGLIIDYMDWRALFWLRIPPHVLWAFLVWRYIRDDLPQRRGGMSIDFIGATLLTFCMITALLAINQGDRLGFDSSLEASLILLTAGLLIVLFVVERTVPTPIIELKLFANRIFSSGVLAQVFMQMAHGAWNFLSPFYLIQGVGFSATLAGLMILPFHLIRLVLSPVSGAVTDRLGTMPLSFLGQAMISGGLLALAQLGFEAPTWQIVLAIAVSGAGLAIFLPPNNIAMMGYVPPNYLSSASGFLATSRFLGTAIGTAIAAAVYSRSLGWPVVTGLDGTSPAVVAAFNDGITVVALASAAGLLAILWRSRYWPKILSIRWSNQGGHSKA